MKNNTFLKKYDEVADNEPTPPLPRSNPNVSQEVNHTSSRNNLDQHEVENKESDPYQVSSTYPTSMSGINENDLKVEYTEPKIVEEPPSLQFLKQDKVYGNVNKTENFSGEPNVGKDTHAQLANRYKPGFSHEERENEIIYIDEKRKGCLGKLLDSIFGTLFRCTGCLLLIVSVLIILFVTWVNF